MGDLYRAAPGAWPIWYHGSLSRAEAEERLTSSQAKNPFLVRQREGGEHVLSLKLTGKQFVHSFIKRHPNGFLQLDGAPRSLPDLNSVVADYMSIMASHGGITPIPAPAQLPVANSASPYSSVPFPDVPRSYVNTKHPVMSRDPQAGLLLSPQQNAGHHPSRQRHRSENSALPTSATSPPPIPTAYPVTVGPVSGKPPPLPQSLSRPHVYGRNQPAVLQALPVAHPVNQPHPASAPPMVQNVTPSLPLEFSKLSIQPPSLQPVGDITRHARPLHDSKEKHSFRKQGRSLSCDNSTTAFSTRSEDQHGAISPPPMTRRHTSTDIVTNPDRRPPAQLPADLCENPAHGQSYSYVVTVNNVTGTVNQEQYLQIRERNLSQKELVLQHQPNSLPGCSTDTDPIHARDTRAQSLPTGRQTSSSVPVAHTSPESIPLETPDMQANPMYGRPDGIDMRSRAATSPPAVVSPAADGEYVYMKRQIVP